MSSINDDFIDKFQVLAAAADILGVTVKELVDTHKSKAVTSSRTEGSHGDASDGGEWTKASSSRHGIEVPRGGLFPTFCSYPGSEDGDVGLNGAHSSLGMNPAVTDAPGAAGTAASLSLLSANPPTCFPATRQPTAIDLWPDISNMTAFENDFSFQAASNDPEDRLPSTDVPANLSCNVLDLQFPGHDMFSFPRCHNPGSVPYFTFPEASHATSDTLPLEPTEYLNAPIPGVESMLSAQPSGMRQSGDLRFSSTDPDIINNSTPEKQHERDGRGPRPLKSRALPATPKTTGHIHGPRRRKRRRYDEIERSETHMTRRLGGCIQCRSRRKRCKRISDHPDAPCESCASGTPRLLCLRGKITDCSLYRRTDGSPFEADHPLIGPDYGHFSRSKIWTADDTRWFECGQGRGTTLRVRGRSLYAIPWAIANLDETVAEVHRYLDSSASPYIRKLIGGSDRIASPIFWHARRLAMGPNPNVLVMQTLRFWTAARFIEGGWRCTGKDKLGAEEISPPWRPKDSISLPPYLDYQLTSIFMERILKSLEAEVLGRLHRMVAENKPDDWFTVVVVMVILMHSFELILEHETAYTRRREISTKFCDMDLLQKYLCGVKTLLAHFHGVTRGALPFKSPFDQAAFNKWPPNLDESQLEIIQSIIQQVQLDRHIVDVSSDAKHCDARFWCIGQIFDTEWKPRKDPERSPLHTLQN